MWNDDSPRTWKWFLPGLISAIFLWGGYMLFNKQMHDSGALLILIGLLGCGLTLTNRGWVIRNREAEILRKRQEALAITPDSERLHAAQGVHPETLRLLLGERARRWGLVSGSQSQTGQPYRFLGARPRVTEEFFIYFLRHSSEKSYMPKRILSDGDTSFDPRHITTAYEMYDDVESLLIEELKATRPFGPTKPGYWLGDWDAGSVGLDFGIDIDESETEAVAGEEDPQASHEEQRQNSETKNGGGMTQMGAEDYRKMGMPKVQADAASGLMVTPAILAKLKKSSS